MRIAFSRTTRALNADRGRAGMLAIIAALLLLAVWTAWFVFGRVTVYEVSRAAHIEVTSASREVSTVQGGRLIASGLFIGRRVRAGEVLAELDSEQQKLQLAEAEVRLAGLPAQATALRRELSATAAAQNGARQAGSAGMAAARARTREAEANAEFNRSLAQKQQADSDSGGAAPVEAERATADAHRAIAAREASRHDEARAAGEAVINTATRAGDAARISANIADADSERAALEQQVAQLRYQVEARKIRAPADGVIGTVAPVKLGEVLGTGSHLATIIPAEDLHVVAAFDPASGLGRLASGQSARLRLDGFSWVQYGDFPATVERVAAESSGDMLRVELRMPRRRDEDLPLRHGMTGQVNVAIEQASPAVLLLRAIGQALG